jgi:hypothetical protein
MNVFRFESSSRSNRSQEETGKHESQVFKCAYSFSMFDKRLLLMLHLSCLRIFYVCLLYLSSLSTVSINRCIATVHGFITGVYCTSALLFEEPFASYTKSLFSLDPSKFNYYVGHSASLANILP